MLRRMTEGERQAVKGLFLYWVARMCKDPVRTSLTPGRRAKLLARLRGGYNEERIRRAIEGCAGSDFHMARGTDFNGRPLTRKYNDLTLICRSGEKLEQFEEMPSEVDGPTGPMLDGGIYREPGQEEALAEHFREAEHRLREEAGDG